MTYMWPGYMQRRAEELLSKGLCIKCGRNALAVGRKQCATCLIASRNYLRLKSPRKALRRLAAMDLEDRSFPPKPPTAIFVVGTLRRGALAVPERLEPEHEKWVADLWKSMDNPIISRPATREEIQWALRRTVSSASQSQDSQANPQTIQAIRRKA